MTIKDGEFEDYNSRQKRLGCKAKTWKEYVAYRKGKSPKVVDRHPVSTEPTTFIRKSPVVPSGVGIGSHTNEPKK